MKVKLYMICLRSLQSKRLVAPAPLSFKKEEAAFILRSNCLNKCKMQLWGHVFLFLASFRDVKAADYGPGI